VTDPLMREHRRARLAELLRARYRGDRSRLLAESGLSKARLSQLLTPSMHFGEQAARVLENKLDLPLRWLDAGLGESPELAPEGPPATLGQRLRATRKARGMTQADLGKGLSADGQDVGTAVIDAWEKDQHEPRVDQLVMLCQRLKVGADLLLFGTAELSPEAIRLARELDGMDGQVRALVVETLHSLTALAKLPRS